MILDHEGTAGPRKVFPDHRVRAVTSEPRTCLETALIERSEQTVRAAHNGTYVALLLYLWVVWRRLTRVAPCLLLGFWPVATPETTDARKGAEQPKMGASETELTATVAELSISTINQVEAIDVYLDPGPFQGLIEIDKHLIPVVHQQSPWVPRPLPLLLMPSYG